MAGTSVLRFGVEREEQGAGRLDARLGAVVRRDQNASVRGGVAGVKLDGESVRIPEARAAAGRLSPLAYGNRLEVSGYDEVTISEPRVLVHLMVDTDLAEVYGVPTNALNQAIKRNADRFPSFSRSTGPSWRRPFSIRHGPSRRASTSFGRSSGCARPCHRIGNSPGAWMCSKGSMPRMTFGSGGSSTPSGR